MPETEFQINVLPAAHGDCIHLRFYSVDHDPVTEKGKQKTEAEESPEEKALRQEQPRYRWYNIVIDSGPVKHKKGFKALMNSIKGVDEKVDLLCFTHVDDDHIMAAEKFFGDGKASKNYSRYIDEVWINFPEGKVANITPQKPRNTEKLTPGSASDLYGYLLYHKEEHDFKIRTEVRRRESDEPEDRVVSKDFGDVKVTAVLPTKEANAAYKAWWEKWVETKKKSKKKTQKLSAGGDASDAARNVDTSECNRSSIVLLIEAFGSKLLFAGDAHADDLETVAKQYADKENGFTLVKLPHHGSSANTSLAMLQSMGCNRFVISANGHSKEVERQSKSKSKKQEAGEEKKEKEVLRPALETVQLLNKYGAEQKKLVTLYGNNPWNYVEKWVEEEKPNNIQVTVLTEKFAKITDDIGIRTGVPL